MAKATRKSAAKPKKATKAKVATRKTTKKAAPKAAVAAPVAAKLPSGPTLALEAAYVIKHHYRVLLGLVLVYLVLNVLFASGLSGLNDALAGIKENLNSSDSQSFAKALSGFGTLVGSAGASGSASASLLQTMLFIVVSLAIIWTLRQVSAGKHIGVKEAYYHSMYPLIPFLMVLGVIFIQMLPLSFGTLFLNAVLTSAAAGFSMLNVVAWLIFIFLAAWSFYMLSSSLFAMYIVTLPEMQPRQALRSAKKLVSGRRLKIIPKLVFLPFIILLVMALIVIPLILVAQGLVVPVFYILSMLIALFIHCYLYDLYRSLLA